MTYNIAYGGLVLSRVMRFIYDKFFLTAAGIKLR
jgi:hypothetical protein